MQYAKLLTDNIQRSIEGKQDFLKRTDQHAVFEGAVTALVAAYRNGGRLYIAGNGGSAADAQHLAAEFVSKLARDRAPMAAEALTVDTSIITAIGNDYGYDEVFARQIEGKMRKGDMFLGITTSGNSRNIIRALEQCRASGFTSILLAGHEGGKAAPLADYCLLASGRQTSTIQELHIAIYHTLCECVENEICN